MQFAKPSSGGAIGVIFVWTTPNTEGFGDKRSWDNPATCAFVVKPLGVSGGGAIMAESLLAELAGAEKVGSRRVEASSPRGHSLLTALNNVRTATGSPRWAEVWPHYQNAKAFMLQDFQVGATDMGEYYRKGTNLAYMLNMNEEFMRNLGMLLVADAVIGNGDRLWNPNTGNIMFKAGGQIVAIDSTTILTNFNSLLNAPDHEKTQAPRWGEFGAGGPETKTPENWAKNQISSKQFPDTEIGGNAASFSMQTLWEIDHWWEHVFKNHLYLGLPDKTLFPPDEFWNKGKAKFMEGVGEGLARVDRLFATKSWDWLKLKFNWYRNKKKYGDDPNMDWMNLKVRRKYYQLRRAGQSHQEAEDAVLAYVKRKMDKVKNG